MIAKLIWKGIVTVAEYTMGPDGQEYRYFYSPGWQIQTDAEMPVEKFRSTEKWQLLGYTAGGELAMMIPGCQVRGFSACNKAPDKHVVCNL